MHPQAKEIMHERDLCSFFFLADRYWHNAFLKDIRGGGYSADTTGWGEGAPGRGVKPETGKFQEQGNVGKMAGAGDWDRSGLGAPSRLGVVFEDAVERRGRRGPTPAGAAMKTCIEDTLPALASLIAAIERCVRSSQ